MTKRLSKNLTSKPEHFRSTIARGLSAQGEGKQIDREGGMFGAGIIKQAAIITRGEALGHGMWIDADMLAQTNDAIKASDGIKIRFTHPGLSSDGTGKYLGRAVNSKVDGDVVRADIHLSESATHAPDGDLANYVLDLANEDPEAFGMSIVFEPDYGSQLDFIEDNGGEFDEFGYLIPGSFRSPDTDNEKNLPHARLSKLRAADVVDEPAANPSGMFHRGQEIPEQAESVVAYLLGLSSIKPEQNILGIDADRMKGFAERFLSRHGLRVMTVKSGDTEMSNENEATEQVEQVENVNDEAQDELSNTDASSESLNDDPAAGNADGQEEQTQTAELSDGERFLTAFGDAGGVYFAKGMTFSDAALAHAESLQAENDKLRDELANAQKASSNQWGSPEGVISHGVGTAAEKAAATQVSKLAAAFGGDEKRAQRVLDLRTKFKKN